MEPPSLCPKCASANLQIARCVLYPGQWVMICASCYHARTYGSAARRMFERRLSRLVTPAVPLKERVWN